MAGSERKRELRRRRHRRVKINRLKTRARNATVSEKAHFAEKLRRMTPGAQPIIETLGLDERSRP